MSHRSHNTRAHRPDLRRNDRPVGREAPRNDVPRPAGPVRNPRESSSEELFGRQPFTYGSELPYFGTGVPGYTSGPGFTGGYYGYGDKPPDIPTELEKEYARDVYGVGPEREAAGMGYDPGDCAAPGWKPSGAGRPRRGRKYPPGPKGYQRSDERIREDICERLMQAEHIDSSEVTVEVQGSKVMLQGTVPDRRMKHAIEDLADACPGVRDIENSIRVQPPAPGGNARS